MLWVQKHGIRDEKVIQGWTITWDILERVIKPSKPTKDEGNHIRVLIGRC